MKFWKAVHDRAWRETRELLRLDQKGRVFLYLAGSAGPPLILFFWQGSFDAAIKGLAVTGALLIAGLAIYAFKLVVTPARIVSSEREASSQHLDQLTAEMAAIRSPPKPPKYATAIFQFGVPVADVTANRVLADGRTSFDLANSSELKSRLAFWYKDELFLAAGPPERTTMLDLTGHQVLHSVKLGVPCHCVGSLDTLQRWSSD